MPKQNVTTLEQRLSLLVAMPTETRNTNACQRAIDSLADELRSLGLFVKNYGDEHPSLVATTRKTKKPKLMLVAHLDVVPATHEGQFEMITTSKKLVGRGVYDMKFAAACYLEFLHEHAENLKDYDLGVMFTTDEEIGGNHGVKMLLASGWKTNIALIPDSSMPWQIEEKAKGRLAVELQAEGKSAHGSRPWEGVNAMENLLNVLAKIQAKYPLGDPEGTTISVTKVTGGEAMNQIPDFAEAWLDVRSFSQKELNDVFQFIQKITYDHGLTYNIPSDGSPLMLDKQNEYVELFCKSLTHVTGKPCEFNKAYGASDGRWFVKHNIPCIVVAPRGGNTHGPGEWISRDDLPRFYDLTVDFINRVHGHKTEQLAPTSKRIQFLKRIFQRL